MAIIVWCTLYIIIVKITYFMRKILLLFLMLLVFVSCADKYSITGTFTQCMFDGKMAYIKQLEDNVMKPVDSCEIVHGEFVMSGALDSVRCVSLFMGESNCIPIVLERGDINVSFANSSIKIGGTPLNDKLYEFLTLRDSLTMLLAELPHKESSMILEGYDHRDIIMQLGQKENEYRKAIDKLETNFIVDNYDNVLGVTWFLELCYGAYNQYGYATTTPQIDEIYSRAPESFRANTDIKAYMKLVDEK